LGERKEVCKGLFEYLWEVCHWSQWWVAKMSLNSLFKWDIFFCT
jgi:hypothetical protein